MILEHVSQEAWATKALEHLLKSCGRHVTSSRESGVGTGVTLGSMGRMLTRSYNTEVLAHQPDSGREVLDIPVTMPVGVQNII